MQYITTADRKAHIVQDVLDREAHTVKGEPMDLVFATSACGRTLVALGPDFCDGSYDPMFSACPTCVEEKGKQFDAFFAAMRGEA